MATLERSEAIKKEAYTVKEIVTHGNTDGDEIAAIWLLRRESGDLYPGIDTATITLDHNRYGGKNWKELMEAGIMCVGTKGSPWDEHAFGEDKEREDDCATTLVAKHLRLMDRPDLKPIIEYTLKRDKGWAPASSWDFGAIVKLAFRYAKTSEQVAEVFYANFLLLEGLLKHQQWLLSDEKFPINQPTVSVDMLIDEWLVAKFGVPQGTYVAKEGDSQARITASRMDRDQMLVLKKMLLYADENRTADRKPSRLARLEFMLGDMLCYMQRYAVTSLSDMRTAMMSLLDGIYQQAYHFHVLAPKDFISSSTHGHFVDGTDIQIISIVSDNPEMVAYCLSKGAGVVLKCVPNGTTYNMQVLFNQKDRRLYLDYAAKHIRIAERQAAKMPLAKLQELVRIGIGEDARWYYAGHGLFNGSLTTDVPPTRLKREEVEMLLLRGIEDALCSPRSRNI